MSEATLKTGWTRVAFGDVVKLSKERSSDPEGDGFERYVGLDHIDPEDLKIRRWGDIADGTTFTNVFRPGQVLFGKRRAYQRKVAVADFPGVCSGDIYVFEPKGSNLLRELLSFICQTDAFFEHAIGTSAGSLSPRTNWKSLASYEFALPPLEEQRRISSVLLASSEHIRRLGEAFSRACDVEEACFAHLLAGNGLSKAKRREHMTFGSVPEDWPLSRISEVGEVAYGISAAVSGNKDSTIGWPILTGANITLSGKLSLEKLVYHPEPVNPGFVLKKGDVLLNWRSGSREHVGKAALFELDGNWTYASFILRIRAREGTNSLFLWRLLNHMRKHQLFGRSTSQQVNFKMNASYFRDVEIIYPPSSIQDQIVVNLQPLWAAQELLESRLQAARRVSLYFLEHILAQC